MSRRARWGVCGLHRDRVNAQHATRNASSFNRWRASPFRRATSGLENRESLEIPPVEPATAGQQRIGALERMSADEEVGHDTVTTDAAAPPKVPPQPARVGRRCLGHAIEFDT